MLKKEKERMTNQTQEQVVDNSNTSSETIKNHYVVSDVKSDNEVIFDIYPTDMSKKVSWGIVADEEEYEYDEMRMTMEMNTKTKTNNMKANTIRSRR